MPLVVAKGFPFWGEFQPIMNQAITRLVLTNSAEHSYLTIENKRVIVWASCFPYFEAGYVCEKKSKMANFKLCYCFGSIVNQAF